MKLPSNINALAAVVTSSIILLPSPTRGAETNAPPERIGIYDSRAIAYAHFWTEKHQRELSDKTKQAKEAKAAGETARYEQLNAELRKDQEQIHLRIFSTAPVEDVLATMKERLEVIRKETGVGHFVSKWDQKALKEHPRAEQVDVTERILQEFKLSEKHKRVADDLRKKEPLPLDKAERLVKGEKL